MDDTAQSKYLAEKLEKAWNEAIKKWKNKIKFKIKLYFKHVILQNFKEKEKIKRKSFWYWNSNGIFFK